MLLHDLRLDLDLIRTARYGKISLSHPDIPLDEIHHAEISYPAVHKEHHAAQIQNETLPPARSVFTSSTASPNAHSVRIRNETAI